MSAWLLPSIRTLAWLLFAGLWALVASRDWREKKISHKHLGAGGVFAGVCYALMGLSTVLGLYGHATVYYHWNFYVDLALHAAAAAAAALAMWQLRIWPAGDTKLFILLALVFPLMTVDGSFHRGWLFLFLLINIFVPAAVAVFLQSCHYMWDTRLRHQRAFFVQLGWGRGVDFAWQKAREALRSMGESLRAFAALMTRSPWEPLAEAWSWIFSFFLMALISYFLGDAVESPILRTMLCFALFFLWSRLTSSLGPWASRGLAAALLAAVVSRSSPELWSEVGRTFSHISIFGFFLYLGMRATLGMAAGQIVLLGVPVLLGVFGGFTEAVRAWLRQPPKPLDLPAPPAPPDLSALAALQSPLAALWHTAADVAPWAALGTFYGLAYAFVRVWEAEDHPNARVEDLKPYMVPHRLFLDQVEKDEEFYEEHFRSVYADGLTAEQAEALKEWCAERDIEEIPLATTISFSNYIFLGYFLTWWLNGHVLRSVL